MQRGRSCQLFYIVIVGNFEQPNSPRHFSGLTKPVVVASVGSTDGVSCSETAISDSACVNSVGTFAAAARRYDPQTPDGFSSSTTVEIAGSIGSISSIALSALSVPLSRRNRPESAPILGAISSGSG